MKAVVLGGTGAIGQELVSQLVCNGAWSQVVTVGRKAVEVLPEYKGKEKAALDCKVIDMDKMEQEAAESFQGANQVFCALGTTRAVAGSAAAFKKVDYEYPAKAAELAKKAGVPHYSLVTAQGSKANVWANDWGIFHGLLYMKCKGMAEEAAKAQGFNRVSIFRPALLLRGDKARGGEKFAEKFLFFVGKIHVSDVAKVMINDALRAAEAAKPVMVFEHSAMVKAAQQNAAPV